MSMKIDAIAYVKKGGRQMTIVPFTPSKYVKEARRIAYGLLADGKVKNDIEKDEGYRAEQMIVYFCALARGDLLKIAEMTRQDDSYMFREYSLAGTYLNVSRAFPDGSVRRYDHAKEQEKARKRFEARRRKAEAQAAKKRRS